MDQNKFLNKIVLIFGGTSGIGKATAQAFAAQGASVAGHIGYANAVIYTTSKHAVIGATRAAALELIKQNIRVNAVSPGGIETDMMYRFFPNSTEREKYALSHPIGRTGKPEEVAEAVLWLASPSSSFVAGHSLVIDGGYTAQ